MKNIFQPLAGLVSLCFFLTSCETLPDGASPQPKDGSGNVVQNVSFKGDPVTVYDYTKDLAAAEYSPEDATRISLHGESADIAGDGAFADGSTVTVTAAGVYILSGTLSDGQIRVDATKEDHVTLVLDGVSVSCSDSAPIYSKQAGKTVVILAPGSVNTLTDAAEYIYDNGTDEPDAALFSKDDLTLAGSGSLTVRASYRNGIGTKDNLCILGGVYTVTAVHDAIRGKDCLAVCGGSFDLTAGNDGLKANNDTEAQAGYIVIDGGTFKITAGHDGLDAANALTINDGTFDVITGEGSAAAPAREAQNGMGRGFGGWGNRPDAGSQNAPTAPVAGEEPTADETEDDGTSDSYKALKSAALVQITGGSFTVDAYEDAVHSDADTVISGGELNLKAGDDGIHADGSLTIDGGRIAILKSYEGLESAVLNITGGVIDITADDDGINASDGSVMTRGGGGFGGGNSAVYIRIQGGDITINADSDGIDSNGNIFLDGGVVRVYGSSDPESAIDADGTITVTGGTMVGIGSVGHMEAPAENSSQPTLMIIFTGEQAAGTPLRLADAQGQTIYEGTSQKSFQSYLFTDPSLVQGKSYRLFVDGKETASITLDTGITIRSETGGEVNRGMGGMGGMGGGREFRR